jgi:hypothetical protein
MNRCGSLQRLGLASLAFCGALFLVQAKCAGSLLHQQQEQQQSPPPPPPTPTQNSQPAAPQPPPTDQPAAKQKKVWTEEDVVLLRTPADTYQVEKEAKEATEAAAAAKEAAIRAAAKSGKQPTLDIKLPATLEETEKRLKDTQGDIQAESDVLDKLHKELLDAPAEQQAEGQKQINRLNTLLEASQRNLKALEEHLRTLREKPQGENPPAVSPPPSL